MTTTERMETLLAPLGSRLEKIARVMSLNSGISVRFNGSSCCTDGEHSITLPDNCDKLSAENMDVVWGKLNHEAEHVRVQKATAEMKANGRRAQVNADILALIKTFASKAITSRHGAATPKDLMDNEANPQVRFWLNVYEDIRIERNVSERWSGAAEHLRALNTDCYKTWAKQLKSGMGSKSTSDLTGIAIIFADKGCDISIFPQAVHDAIKALTPILRYSDDKNLRTVWDSYNLALATVEAIASEGSSMPKPEAKPQPGKGEEDTTVEGEESEEEPEEVTPAEALRALRNSSPTMSDPMAQTSEKRIQSMSRGATPKDPTGMASESYSVNPKAATQDRIEVPVSDPAATKNLRRDVERHAATLSARLRTLLMARSVSRKTFDNDSGKLDRRSLYRLNRPGYLPSRNIFTKDISGEKHDVAVMVMLDCSGSMHSGKTSLAKQGVLLLGDTLKTLETLGVKFAVYGFTADTNWAEEHGTAMRERYSREEPVLHYRFKNWSENWAITSSRVGSGQTQMNNADADSVKWACSELMGQKASRRILYVLSDGAPAVAGKREDQVKELQRVVAGAEKVGIEVFGLGILSHQVRRFYRNNRVVTKTEDLPAAIIEMATQWFNNK